VDFSATSVKGGRVKLGDLGSSSLMKRCYFRSQTHEGGMERGGGAADWHLCSFTNANAFYFSEGRRPRGSGGRAE
jgi:hypothetical protein